jgi:hypothetical protein
MERGRGRSDAGLQLQPVGMRSRVWLALLSFVLPVALGVILPFFDDGATAASRWIHASLQAQRWAEQWFGPVLVAAVAGTIWLVIDRMLLRHDLRIDAAGVDIRTTMYRRRLHWNDLDMAAARVIDIDEHPDARPLLKSNGVAIPGFRSGWFRSRAFTKLFVATAGGTRLLRIPTRLGYALLLQPVNPVATLDRMREAARGAGPATTGNTALR